jgi:hypothetical protein
MHVGQSKNPAMFWDIDQYFYGEQKNPCQNRREVLEKYCQYLEVTYPWRCCNNDERKTSQLPAPKVKMFMSGGCHICKEFYGEEMIYLLRNLSLTADKDNASMEMQKMVSQPKEKITSRVIAGQCIKPFHGSFFGQHGGIIFK